MQPRAEGLRRIVEREHAAVALADGADGGPVRRQAVEVHADHGARPQLALARHALDAALEVGEVEVEGGLVHVHEDRHGAEHQRHLGGRGVGEGGQEHGVTAPDALGHHGDLERVRARGHAHAMRDAGEGGELLLQRVHFRPLDEAAMVQHAGDAGLDAGADQRLLRLQIEEGDGRRGGRHGVAPARGGVGARRVAPVPSRAKSPAVSGCNRTAGSSGDVRTHSPPPSPPPPPSPLPPSPLPSDGPPSPSS